MTRHNCTLAIYVGMYSPHTTGMNKNIHQQHLTGWMDGSEEAKSQVRSTVNQVLTREITSFSSQRLGSTPSPSSLPRPPHRPAPPRRPYIVM